jgi:hypothetical protein
MLAALRHGLLVAVFCGAGASLAQNAVQTPAPLRLQLTPKELSATLATRDGPSPRTPAEPPPPVTSQCKTLPVIATIAALAIASQASATTVDGGNFIWMFKKPEDRKIADFLSVHPSPAAHPSSGTAAEQSTLHP